VTGGGFGLRLEVVAAQLGERAFVRLLGFGELRGGGEAAGFRGGGARLGVGLGGALAFRGGVRFV